ncbi:hypothetical protein OLZ31_26395, partial [Enterobacter asburiae]|nr:hypothetical protein [Enterobacter asburiae]
LESWQWTTPANSLGVTAASPGSLESILDYQDSGMTHPSRQLPYNPVIRRISQTEPKAPWYNFEESAVKPQGTIYPWSQSRIGGAPRTMQALKNRHEGKNKYGKDTTPLVMAIEDPVGIAHELAGFGDDFAALHAAWVDDLSIEFFTDQSLVSVQTQLEKQGEAMKKWMIEQGRKNAPLVEAMTSNWSGTPSSAFNEQYQQNTAQNAQHTGDEIAHQWSKYDAKLNHEKRMAFRQCYTRFCGVLSSQMEALHQLRISWLTSPLFITCSQDFYSIRTADNLSYLGVVDYALASLNLTDTGISWLDTLINQYSAQEESNLVWRSILLNNPTVISEMETTLRNLAKHHGDAKKPDEATLLAALAPLAGKFTEAYGQANEIVEKNPTASSSFSQIMLHCDRRMGTLGDRFFNFTRLGQSIDGLNTLISKAIFQVASGYSYADTVRMSVAQLQDGMSFRQHVLSSLNKGSEVRLTTVNRYQSEFDEFVHSAEGKKALKGMRIKLLALFFNGLESANLLRECKGNVKDVAQVAAAFLAAMSTASEIVEPLVKDVFKSDGAFKGIKLLGAGAGSVASVISFTFD